MHLQSSLPKLSFQRKKMRKKMNSHQNDTVLVKFTLALQFLICLKYTWIGFTHLILCNYVPRKTSISAPDLHAFFSLVIGFRFMQFDPQLIIKLSISLISSLISIDWVPIIRRLLQIGPCSWFLSINLVKINFGFLKF